MLAEKIKKQILERMEGKNLNVSTLERQANLPVNSIRNIIYGSSKNPGIKSLTAIAEVLGCGIDDLLGKQEARKIKKNPEEAPEYNELIIDLFDEIVNCIEVHVKQHNITLTFEQFLSLIKEAYIFSLRKNSNKLNPSFIEWLIENRVNQEI